jgi:hypothetical protein
MGPCHPQHLLRMARHGLEALPGADAPYLDQLVLASAGEGVTIRRHLHTVHLQRGSTGTHDQDDITCNMIGSTYIHVTQAGRTAMTT